MTEPTFKAIEKCSGKEFICTDIGVPGAKKAEYGDTVTMYLSGEEFSGRFAIPAKSVGERMAEEMVVKPDILPRIRIGFGGNERFVHTNIEDDSITAHLRTIIASAIDAARAGRPKVSNKIIFKLGLIANKSSINLDSGDAKEILAALGVAENDAK